MGKAGHKDNTQYRQVMLPEWGIVPLSLWQISLYRFSPNCLAKSVDRVIAKKENLMVSFNIASMAFVPEVPKGLFMLGKGMGVSIILHLKGGLQRQFSV